MTQDLGHGDRLSGEEYDRRIVHLYRNAPPMPSREEDRALRKKELNFAIDYRLGVKFPQDRRDQLWAIMEQVEQKRLWLGMKYAFKHLLTARKAISKDMVHKTEGLAGFMIDEFAAVLNQQELRSFSELESGERPSLPVDSDVSS